MNFFRNITIKCKSDEIKSEGKESPIENKSLKEIFLKDVKEVLITEAEMMNMSSKLFGLFFQIMILFIVLDIFNNLIFPQAQNLQENQVFQFKKHIKDIFEIFSKFNNISTKDVKKDILSLAKKYFKCKFLIILDKKHDKDYSPEELTLQQLSYICFPNIKLCKDPADSTAEELTLAILANFLMPLNKKFFFNMYQFFLIEQMYFCGCLVGFIVSFFTKEVKSSIHVTNYTFDYFVIKEEFVDNAFDAKLESIFLECMALYNICKDDPNIKVILKQILKLKINRIDPEVIKSYLKAPFCYIDKITETELLVILVISYVLYKHKEC